VTSRLAACCLAVLLASTARADTKDKDKVGNFVPFDLAVCFMKPAAVEAPATDTALSGLWILARPLVLECMADTRFFVPGKSSAFKVTLTVDDKGFTQTVDSDGLTAFGKKCIQDAVLRVSPPLAPLPTGSKPATFSEQWPELPPTTQVRFGVNEFSDVTGTVRLALPALCPCFAPFEKGPVPAAIGLKVRLTQAPEKFKAGDGSLPPPVLVTVADAAPAEVKSCLTPKLTALPYPKPKSDQIEVPYEITFLNSLADTTDTSKLPDSVRFAQLDAMAVPRAATSQLELDRKVKSSDAYNALVKQYQELAKKDPKKAKGMLKDLVASCKKMVAQDDVYISSLESENTLRQEQLSVVTALGAKNAAWAPLEAAAKKTASESEALVNKAKELKASDEKVCPKVHL